MSNNCIHYACEKCKEPRKIERKIEEKEKDTRKKKYRKKKRRRKSEFFYATPFSKTEKERQKERKIE